MMDHKGAVANIVAFYAVLFSSLAVHEFSHIYAAQYITKDCIFTETDLRFDLLLIRQSGMTYFTCSQGVTRVSPPSLSLSWDDFTSPILHIKVARAEGIRQITSPLTTGWFAALMGPAIQLIFVAMACDWLSKTFRRLELFAAAFPVLLLIVFWSGISDFNQVMTGYNQSAYILGYLVVFAVAALTQIGLNIQTYKRVLRA
jgi:hypothetical protein